MSIIFISMRPQSVAVNLILPRERTENDRGNESCLQSLNTKLKYWNYFAPSRSLNRSIRIVHYSNASCVLLSQLARNRFLLRYILHHECVLERKKKKKRKRRGRRGYQSLPWKFRGGGGRKGGEEIIWSNGEIMDKFLRFNDKTWNEFPPRMISNVSHRSSIFSRFISLRRNYAEWSAGVACLFIPRDSSAFSPVQFRSRNLHPPTLESSTDVPFSRCFHAGFRVPRNMYLRFSVEIGRPVVSFQSCSINLGSTPLSRNVIGINLVYEKLLISSNLYERLDQTSCFLKLFGK